jgi:hypothetical protein
MPYKLGAYKALISGFRDLFAKSLGFLKLIFKLYNIYFITFLI